MHKGFLKLASILAALSVALGAFAAHSLKGSVSERAIATFETAVRYQFYHVFALFITGIVYAYFPYKTVKFAGYFFMAGILFFSGSLYGLAFVQAIVQPGFQWLGPLTPVGGLFFIVGWILLCISFFRKPLIKPA